MSENGRPVDWPDMALYYENRRKIPPEYLLPYAGQHVAWSLDGTQILASGQDIPEVEGQLLAAGIPPNQVVFGFISSPDGVQI
jgi:hypothetical protein